MTSELKAPIVYVGKITMVLEIKQICTEGIFQRDVIISIVVLIITIALMTKYGLRVYKVGILNYSNEKIWSRFAKALKSKDM